MKIISTLECILKLSCPFYPLSPSLFLLARNDSESSTFRQVALASLCYSRSIGQNANSRRNCPIEAAPLCPRALFPAHRAHWDPPRRCGAAEDHLAAGERKNSHPSFVSKLPHLLRRGVRNSGDMITLTKILGKNGRTNTGQPTRRVSVRDKLLIKEVKKSFNI